MQGLYKGKVDKERQEGQREALVRSMGKGSEVIARSNNLRYGASGPIPIIKVANIAASAMTHRHQQLSFRIRRILSVQIGLYK